MAAGLGADVQAEGIRFLVWASKRRRVEVLLQGSDRVARLKEDSDGYFAGLISEVKAGMRYQYRLDGKETCLDPCSRFQPEGPNGPSMVIDPSAYAWRDTGWRGVRMHGQVIYELHIGTFTPEGIFDKATKELDELKGLGITLIEVMPVAEFPGKDDPIIALQDRRRVDGGFSGLMPWWCVISAKAETIDCW